MFLRHAHRAGRAPGTLRGAIAHPAARAASAGSSATTVVSEAAMCEQAFLSSTMVNQRFVLRLCIVNHNTTWDDVRETLEAVERVAMDESE